MILCSCQRVCTSRMARTETGLGDQQKQQFTLPNKCPSLGGLVVMTQSYQQSEGCAVLASFLGTAGRCCLGPFWHEQKHVQVDVRLKYSEHPSWLEIHFVHTLTVVCAYLLVQSVLHDRSIVQAII